MDVKLYKQMMGSFVYVALRSPPDNFTPVLMFARFRKPPTPYCHRAVKRVLQFLKGTSSTGILFEQGTLKMRTQMDDDHASDVVVRKLMIMECNIQLAVIQRWLL